jgi:hypothetical protein
MQLEIRGPPAAAAAHWYLHIARFRRAGPAAAASHGGRPPSGSDSEVLGKGTRPPAAEIEPKPRRP